MLIQYLWSIMHCSKAAKDEMLDTLLLKNLQHVVNYCSKIQAKLLYKNKLVATSHNHEQEVKKRNECGVKNTEGQQKLEDICRRKRKGASKTRPKLLKGPKVWSYGIYFCNKVFVRICVFPLLLDGSLYLDQFQFSFSYCVLFVLVAVHGKVGLCFCVYLSLCFCLLCSSLVVFTSHASSVSSSHSLSLPHPPCSRSLSSYSVHQFRSYLRPVSSPQHSDVVGLQFTLSYFVHSSQTLVFFFFCILVKSCSDCCDISFVLFVL